MENRRKLSNRFINRCRTIIWNIYFRVHGAKVGKNIKVEGPIEFLLRDGSVLCNLLIGDNVSFGGKTYIRMRKNGKIILENGVRTGVEVWFVSANNSELWLISFDFILIYDNFSISSTHNLSSRPFTFSINFLHVLAVTLEKPSSNNCFTFFIVKSLCFAT